MSRVHVCLLLAALIASPALSAGPVDEPLGARYSLGLTLWHLGHQADRIQAFHEFLADCGEPLDALRQEAGATLPETSCSLLLEPELLEEGKLSGWRASGKFITSGATDAGPSVQFPLTIPRDGTYRLWVRYYGWTTGTAVTGLRFYPRGSEHLHPVVSDEIYDYAVPTEGLQWKDTIVDLGAGEYTVRLSHITRWWHAGKGPKGYLPRQIDCLYLTDALWREAPDDAALDALRNAEPLAGIQWTEETPLSAEDRDAWQMWAVRPVCWERREDCPRLFALSREFWREQVEQAAATDYDEADPPDYREPSRQVIFDDRWNMVGNPVRIMRQIAALQSDIRREPTDHEYLWINAGEFDEVTGSWERQGTTLWATYSDFSGTAKHALHVGRGGDYHVWVRFRNINYFAPWRLTATAPDGAEIKFERDQQSYPKDGNASATWQKVGVLTMPADADMRLLIVPMLFKNPGTYRGVHSILATTDPDHVPAGSVKPAITPEQYLSRAGALGASASEGYMLWTPPDAQTPLAQESWPSDLDQGSQKALPGRELDARLVMATDAVRSVPVYLRGMGEEPRTVSVSCGPLEGGDGRFEGKVSWRVVSFVPYGSGRQEWSPFLLLRRPDVKVPPWGVAGIWLSVDSVGVPPGSYRSTVTLSSEGLPDRQVRLAVRVSGVRIEPKRPVLVGGWTAPPEGEEYMADYQAHGMNIWYSPMTRAEMTRWGIKLLALQRWEVEPGEIARTIAQLKAGGVDYSDFIFTIKDEPTGKTEEELKPYLDVAKAIREADPNARISFNPGDTADLRTFQVLDPLCEFWLPYSHHRHYHPNEAAAKRAIFTPKPWMWYTTPCLWDKSPGLPRQLYDQIRSVPAQPGNCVGTAFFAFYYPFRDPWDTAYEFLPDAAVTVLPSRNGPVPTHTWEAIREGIQHANLANMVREKLGIEDFEAIQDEAVRKMVASGSVEELIEWLEANP